MLILTFASSTGKPRVHLYTIKIAQAFTIRISGLAQPLTTMETPTPKAQAFSCELGQAVRRQLSCDLPFFRSYEVLVRDAIEQSICLVVCVSSHKLHGKSTNFFGTGKKIGGKNAVPSNFPAVCAIVKPNVKTTC